MKVKLSNSTIAQKVVVGLSGLALCGFLATHLFGSLLIYAPGDGYSVYNHYAQALHANPLLPVFEIVLLVLFLAHIVLTIIIVLRNRESRPEGYAVKRSKRGASLLTAHNVMHLTGFVVLAFLILHMLDFRFPIRFPDLYAIGETDPARRTIEIMQTKLSAAVYFVGSLLLGYHLYHGFQSAFQTLGANHPKLMPAVRAVGIGFAVLVAVGFASFSVWAMFLLQK